MIVNCNYQRLDGPVRGNSKVHQAHLEPWREVIQEFEGIFRGAGCGAEGLRGLDSEVRLHQADLGRCLERAGGQRS